MLRKLCLALIAVFAFSLGPEMQATLAMGVLFFAMSLHLLKKPFVAGRLNLNRMEAMSIFCTFMVFASGIVFDDDHTSSGGKIVTSVAFISSIAGVSLFLLGALARELFRGFKATRGINSQSR